VCAGAHHGKGRRVFLGDENDVHLMEVTAKSSHLLFFALSIFLIAFWAFRNKGVQNAIKTFPKKNHLGSSQKIFPPASLPPHSPHHLSKFFLYA
jgi:hypothetical protein